MTISTASPITPMVPAFNSQMLTLIHNFKQPSTNLFPLNDFVADILTQAALKTVVLVKIHNNASTADFVDGCTSPKIVTCPTGSAPYNTRDNASSANNMKCTGRTSRRHVHIRDDVRREWRGKPEP